MQQHLLEAHTSSHRFPHLWLTLTTVVVALAFVAMGFYASKIYQTRRAIDSSRQAASVNAAPAASSSGPAAQPASPVPTTSGSASASSQPGVTSLQATTSQSQQASQDLKTVDLAELKASIGELKSVVEAF